MQLRSRKGKFNCRYQQFCFDLKQKHSNQINFNHCFTRVYKMTKYTIKQTMLSKSKFKFSNLSITIESMKFHYNPPLIIYIHNVTQYVIVEKNTQYHIYFSILCILLKNQFKKQKKKTYEQYAASRLNYREQM